MKPSTNSTLRTRSRSPSNSTMEVNQLNPPLSFIISFRPITFVSFSPPRTPLPLYSTKERIIMSCNIYKFNDYKKRQERNFLITTHAIYNLNGSCNLSLHFIFRFFYCTLCPIPKSYGSTRIASILNLILISVV